ncbi:MAG: hypothetical protein ABR568_04290, partial [Pyrinomonadaceae bacterium]
IAVAQDPRNLPGDKGRSSYDRPHRVSGNFVYELPWYRDQQGLAGLVLGGWQFNGFVTFQSGAPFTPLNGADPTGALNGIDGLVGNAIRANVLAPLPTTNTEELFNLIRGQGQQLFGTLQCNGPLTAAATTCQRFGNAGRNILNQWTTDGGNRRIIIGVRLVF